MFKRSLLLIVLTAVCLPGCGGSNGPELGEVTGVVTVGGSPAANAIVTFSPTSEGRPSIGETDGQGKYTLLYTTDSPGALIGTHQVTLELITSDAADDAPDDEADLDEGQEMPDAIDLPSSATDGSVTKDVKSGSNEINVDFS